MQRRVLVSRHQDLDAFRLARNLAVRVHTMALQRPHSERMPAAQAMRRVARVVVEAIVAVADRPLARMDVVGRLTHAQTACDEARVHLDLLCRSGVLAEAQYRNLHDGYLRLHALLVSLTGAAQIRGQAALWATLLPQDDAPRGC